MNPVEQQLWERTNARLDAQLARQKGRPMATQDYQGWSNRATWNVVLWIGNDEPLYRWAVDTVRRYQKDGKPFDASAARAFCEQAFGDKTPDNCEVASANFAEVASALVEMAGS